MTDTTPTPLATACPGCKAPTAGNVEPHCRDTTTNAARVCGWVICQTCHARVDLRRNRAIGGTEPGEGAQP